jgi:hypothetical protein
MFLDLLVHTLGDRFAVRQKLNMSYTVHTLGRFSHTYLFFVERWQYNIYFVLLQYNFLKQEMSRRYALSKREYNRISYILILRNTSTGFEWCWFVNTFLSNAARNSHLPNVLFGRK